MSQDINVKLPANVGNYLAAAEWVRADLLGRLETLGHDRIAYRLPETISGRTGSPGGMVRVKFLSAAAISAMPATGRDGVAIYPPALDQQGGAEARRLLRLSIMREHRERVYMYRRALATATELS